MTNYSDLIAQRDTLAKQQAELESRIRDARLSERRSVITQIEALMAEHGLTVQDLKPAKAGKAAAAGSRKGPKPGGKVAPKYRDTATGDTWSGRGLQPKWLKARLAEGRKLQDFAV